MKIHLKVRWVRVRAEEVVKEVKEGDGEVTGMEREGLEIGTMMMTTMMIGGCCRMEMVQGREEMVKDREEMAED